jgi:hypothetical protein
LQPDSLQLLALKRAENGEGFILRAQAFGARPVRARLQWMKHQLDLGVVRTGQIVTWRLEAKRKGWNIVRVDLAENPLKPSHGS